MRMGHTEQQRFIVDAMGLEHGLQTPNRLDMLKGQVRSGLHANGRPVLELSCKKREYVHSCCAHAAKIDKRIKM